MGTTQNRRVCKVIFRHFNHSFIFTWHSLEFQVQLPVDLDLVCEPAAPAAVAVRVHAGGGRGGHGERLGAPDGGGDHGRPGGAPQDRDGPHDRAAPQEGAHPGKKLGGLNQL